MKSHLKCSNTQQHQGCKHTTCIQKPCDTRYPFNEHPQPSYPVRKHHKPTQRQGSRKRVYKCAHNLKSVEQCACSDVENVPNAADETLSSDDSFESDDCARYEDMDDFETEDQLNTQKTIHPRHKKPYHHARNREHPRLKQPLISKKSQTHVHHPRRARITRLIEPDLGMRRCHVGFSFYFPEEVLRAKGPLPRIAEGGVGVPDKMLENCKPKFFDRDPVEIARVIDSFRPVNPLTIVFPKL